MYEDLVRCGVRWKELIAYISAGYSITIKRYEAKPVKSDPRTYFSLEVKLDNIPVIFNCIPEFELMSIIEQSITRLIRIKTGTEESK